MAERFDELDPVSRWIVEQGLGAQDLVLFVAGLAERLVTTGLPLSRVHLSFPTLDPVNRGENVVWLRGRGAVAQKMGHERFEAAYQASPFPEMLRTNTRARRWRLTDRASAEGFAVLEECREEGATDYIVHLVQFTTEGSALLGVAVSAATDRAGGFGEREVAALTSLVPAIALASYRIALSGIMERVLGAYIGHDAGRRVLGGEIRRGEGHRVTAALMFADLRGFTAATEAAGAAVIARLGEHLAAMAEPVEEAGGEVLKFLGDGLLAAFPVVAADQARACSAALAAAEDAIRRNARVNEGYPETPPLDLDVALHLGEVFYGNVGAGSRLDFTVIGSAVNEASRLEGLCGQLGRPLVMSEPFAAACGRPAVSLGAHRLRGLERPREVFGLAGG